MIKIQIAQGRETYTLQIMGKTVWYRDRKTKIKRLLPAKKGQNPFDSVEDKKAYKNCRTEKQLAEYLIKDAEKNGGRLLLKIENGNI